jgi:hypothetical protein
MKPNDIKRAYKAIKDHVRTHVTGDADDLFCACQDAFDRQKHQYDAAKGEIEDFAAAVARSALSHEAEAADTRKCREVEHYDSRALRHGEKREKKRISALVEKALKKLPAEDRGIIAWELCGLELKVLQDIWQISEKAFYKYHVNPARDAFAKAFGEVVGNPKLYAKLRSEVFAKKKGQN